MELDQDLPPPPFVRVLEWEWDGKHTGEQYVAEPAEPAGEMTLLGLGQSKLALPAISASLRLTCWWPRCYFPAGNLHLPWGSWLGRHRTLGNRPTSWEWL